MIDSNFDKLLADIISSTDMRALVARYGSVSERSDGMYASRCPFHTATTSGLVIDPEHNVCFCLECDDQWGAVDFLMARERISYAEAVGRLAKAAAIELSPEFKSYLSTTSPHREPTDIAPSELINANRFAIDYFHKTLTGTDDGRSIGLAYLRERSVSDAMIERFNLGYALEDRTHFFKAAVAAGHSPAALATVGLVVATDRGDHYDRYHGRVIFPVHTVSGEPIAFGARTLRTDKDTAKYVNSPESIIYSKSNELYGLYQAREAIETQGYCVLVEGYLDVISMHQAGLQNVVAASGTSLTEGQVALLRRFTDRITVIFDSDAAGIKASVRSIDMLLSADMEVSLVSLPDGEDPDSYARTHSREEIERYLADNAIDFVEFKMRLGAERIKKDPIERARVINDIIASISTIPDRRRMRAFITRTAFAFKMNERTLADQLQKKVAERLARRYQRTQSALNGAHADDGSDGAAFASVVRSTEEELLGYVVRNAMVFFCDTVQPDSDQVVATSVIEFVDSELKIDNLRFRNNDLGTVFDRALEISRRVADEDLEPYRIAADRRRAEMVESKRTELLGRSIDMASLDREERMLEEESEKLWNETFDDLCGQHVANILLADRDPGIRSVTARLVRPHEMLSKIHTRNNVIENERQRLSTLLPHALCVLKMAVVKNEITDIAQRLSAATDPEEIRKLMERRMTLDRLKQEFSRFLGNRVII